LESPDCPSQKPTLAGGYVKLLVKDLNDVDSMPLNDDIRVSVGDITLTEKFYLLRNERLSVSPGR